MQGDLGAKERGGTTVPLVIREMRHSTDGDTASERYDEGNSPISGRRDTMDGTQFDLLTRALGSRRVAVGGVLGSGLVGLCGLLRHEPAKAKRKHKKKKRKCKAGTKKCGKTCKPSTSCCNNADCASGRTCQDGVCDCPSGTKDCGGVCLECCDAGDCSDDLFCLFGECQTGAGTCPSGADVCVDPSPNQPCNGNTFCFCFTTTVGATRCGDTVSGGGDPCVACVEDADCDGQSGYHAGAFCAVFSGDGCPSCPAGAHCVNPCPPDG